MRFPTFSLPILALGALFFVFAPAAPAATAPEASAADRDADDAAYVAFESAAKAYREGLAQAASGERRAGRRAANRAMDRMLDAADDCARSASCDRDVLLARLDALMGAQTRVAGEGASANEAAAAAAITEGVSADTSPVVAAFPEASNTINQLNGRDLRELIVQNEAVRAAMAEWLTTLRPQLINAHEQYQYLRFLMWPEYERAGLPEALLFAIMARESGGRVHAISPAGAAGLMQFMPATGRRFGMGLQDGFDTRFEPQQAARASTEYLNERFAQLGHDLELALAAYNGGEGRIGRLAREFPGKSFWDPAVYARLPKETRDYVPYILSAAWLFLHPEDYGLNFPKVDGAATLLVLREPASINALTICIGNGPSRYGYFRALRNLNPRWLPEVELPAGTALRVPVTVMALYDEGCVDSPRAERTAALMKARKPSVEAIRTAGGARYTVRRGDTLSAIARRHGCSAQTVARINGLRSPYALRPGQNLSLDACQR